MPFIIVTTDISCNRIMASANLVFLQLKPFNLSSPPLSTYNQQLWLTCVVELDQHDGENLT